MAAYVPEYLKSKNRKLVFDLFANYKVLSRAEIVQKTEMSFPTVSKAVDFLLSRNIVQEIEGEKESCGPGRKRQGLQFNSSAYSALTINFEGKYAEIGLVDLSGNLFAYETMAFEDFTDYETLKQLGERLKQLISSSKSPVLGVGLGLPTDVNPHTTEIIGRLKNNFGAYKSVSFQENFAPMLEQLPVDIYVENDVNMACVGEMFCRSHMVREQSLCYLSLGTGFGSGIAINGKLWRGCGYRAGEIGHTLMQPVDFSKPLDGQVEPIENMINIRAIQKEFGIELTEQTKLSEELKEKIIGFILPGLASSIYNLIYLFDIEEYVLSGYVPQILGQPLLDRVSECLNGMLEGRNRKLRISSPSSSYTPLIGAAQMVFEGTILKELKD